MFFKFFIIGIVLGAALYSKSENRVSGFIALDLLERTKFIDEASTYEMGIGTLNVNVNSVNEDTKLKIKLDLDGDLSSSNNTLYEEANVTQQVSSNFSFRIGKGVVPFHNKQYGAIIDSYFDRGSILSVGRYITFGDQDRKILLSLIFGGKATQFRNSVTVYGDPALSIDSRNENKLNCTDANGNGVCDEYPDTGKVFNPRDQLGVTNKLEYFLNDEWTLNTAILYYRHRLNPHRNIAFEIGGGVRKDGFRGWFEAQIARSSQMLGLYERYSGFKDRKELILQFGGEVDLSEKISIIFDFEMASFSSRNTTYNSDEKGTFAKVDTGVAYHFSPSMIWTNGLLWENLKEKNRDQKNGYQMKSSVKYMF